LIPSGTSKAMSILGITAPRLAAPGNSSPTRLISLILSGRWRRRLDASFYRSEDAIVFEAFFKDKLAPLTLRMALGLFCVYHGFSKIMADGGMSWYPGLAVGWQLFIAWGEFSAGLAILLGFHCRKAAALFLGLTIGTLLWWQGWNVFRLSLLSLEPTLLVLLLGVALLFQGAGELSLDGRAGGSGQETAKSGKKKAAA